MNKISSSFTDILIKIVGDATGYNKTMSDVKSKTKDMENSVKNSMNNVSKSSNNTAKNTSTSFGHLIDFEKSAKNQLGDLSQEISTQGSRWQQYSSRAMAAVQPLNQKIYESGNRVKQAGQKIKDSLGTEASLAFAAAGAAALSFAKNCVSSAMAAESAWARFGGIVDSNGGNWKDQQRAVKEWATDFSTQMGYATSDTREAATNLMMYGMSLSDTMEGMKGVAGLAARAGITEAEASNVIIQALNGRGRALKKYTGLQIEDYKATDGNIDKMKLLSDIYEKSADALDAHANTTEANIQRMSNMWNSFKSEIGRSLLPVVRIVADVVTAIVKGFKKLPDPVKTVITTLLLIGGAVSAVVGALGFIAPALMGVGEIMMAFSKAGGAVGLFLKFGPLLKSFATGLAADFSALGGFLISPWGLALIAVVAFVAIMWHLYNTNESVRNSLNNLGSFVSGVLVNAWNTLSYAATQVWNWLQQVGQTVMGMLVPAWNELVSQAMPLYNALLNLGSKLNDLWIALNGGNSAISGGTEGFTLIGAAVKLFTDHLLNLIQFVILVGQTVLAIVIPVITKVVSDISSVVGAITSVVQVINDLMNGNISLGDALMSIGGIIVNLGSEISTHMLQMLGDIASNLGGVFDSLPGVVQEELMNIANVLMNGGLITSAIISLCTQIIDFFKGVLGINSPGIMAQSIQEEMGHIAEFISGAVGGIISAIVQLGLGMLTAFLSIPGMISAQFMQIVTVITQWLSQARLMALALINAMVMGLVLRISGFINSIRLHFMQFVNVVRARFTQARTIASTLVTAMRTAIVTKVQNIVSRVQSYFARIPSVIRSRLANAVSSARAKASEIYNSIKNKISEIPGIVATEMGKIPGKITSALASAASAAASGAANIVSRFASALGINSPGFMQRMMVYEFTSMVDIIATEGVRATRVAGDTATNIVKAWNNSLPDQLPVPEIDFSDSTDELFEDINKSATKITFSDLKNNVVESLLNLDSLKFNVEDYNNLNISRDLKLLGTDFNNPQLVKTSPSITNHYNTNEGNSRTIIVENMNNNMEMANLTKAESRRVLYDALDGLYDGVIGNG